MRIFFDLLSYGHCLSALKLLSLKQFMMCRGRKKKKKSSLGVQALECSFYLLWRHLVLGKGSKGGAENAAKTCFGYSRFCAVRDCIQHQTQAQPLHQTWLDTFMHTLCVNQLVHQVEMQLSFNLCFAPTYYTNRTLHFLEDNSIPSFYFLSFLVSGCGKMGKQALGDR